MTVYFKTEDAVEEYDNIVDAIAISDSTVRVELASGKKAKKDGWLFGADDGPWEVMVSIGGNMRTMNDVDRVHQMPHHRVKMDDLPMIGGQIKRINKT